MKRKTSRPGRKDSTATVRVRYSYPLTPESAALKLEEKRPGFASDLLEMARAGADVARTLDYCLQLSDWYQAQLPKRFRSPPPTSGKGLADLVAGTASKLASGTWAAVDEANRAGTTFELIMSALTAFFPVKFLKDERSLMMLSAQMFPLAPYVRVARQWAGIPAEPGSDALIKQVEVVAVFMKLVEKTSQDLKYMLAHPGEAQSVFELGYLDFALLAIAIGLEKPPKNEADWRDVQDRWRKRRNVQDQLKQAFVRYLELTGRIYFSVPRSGEFSSKDMALWISWLMQRFGVKLPKMATKQKDAFDKLETMFEIGPNGTLILK